MRIEKLEKLASEMVGDGMSPDVYFVTRQPQGVMMITRDFDAAYRYWRKLPRNIETCLENRRYGVICSTEPKEEGGIKLVTYDDGAGFKRLFNVS